MKAWAEWFYKSKVWAETREAYLISQQYLCERCGAPAKIVHHKDYITRENINDQSTTLCWDNLEALCQECHNKEHHAKSEKKMRYRFTEDGSIAPPPIHEKILAKNRPRGDYNFTLQGRACVV